MIATTIGLIPANTGATCGSDPHFTYAAAMIPVMNTAGKINEIPAMIRPRQPPLRCPIWIANSVEFGPGMRWAAPSKSMKSSCFNHLRRSTTSSCIIATWAAGPPKPIVPSLKKSLAIELHVGEGNSIRSVINDSWLVFEIGLRSLENNSIASSLKGYYLKSSR